MLILNLVYYTKARAIWVKNMTIKRFYIYIISFFIGITIASNANAMTFAEFVYIQAKNNNLSTIKTYLSKGYPIDATDTDGNTALCYAIEYKDFNAYKNIKSLGASTNHPCTQRTTKETTDNFEERYDVVNKTNAQNSFITQDKTTLYTGAGIVAAGALAVALSSGGGSSGDKKQSTPEKPSDPTDRIPEKEEIICPEGQGAYNGKCVPINPNTGCLEGEKLVNGVCEKITCEEGYHLVGNSCLPDQGQSDNLTEIDGFYFPLDDVLIENNKDEDVFGIYSNGSEVYNLFSAYARPNDYQEIDITNIGHGRVIGMYGEGHATNSYVDGLRLEGEINPKDDGTGYIRIRNYGSGNVYGLYSKIIDAQNSWEAANSYGADLATARGTIDIKNYGQGSTYGIWGDDRAYNAIARTGGKSYGDINIEANGNITGVGGYMGVFNATSHQMIPGREVIANINIKSTGNGDIYGIQVDKDTKELDNPDGPQQWFAMNAASDGGDYVEGNVNIKNFGNGNVYGMYGGQQLYNGMYYGGMNEQGLPYGKAVANINIENHGNGNIYGMYMPEADVNGMIINIDIEGFENGAIGQTGVTSTINLVNTGDGVTTGMRGGQYNRIQNTGTININNLGNGTAIGIYGESNSRIENDGKINIFRQEYTDAETNITYTPDTAIGGTAYGIYAETGASITNNGEITITNANNGHGIYLEHGASLENNGTITFNGNNEAPTTGGVIDIYGNRELSSANLNNIGNGEIILGSNGRFFADTLRGDLSVSNKVTLTGFEDTYTLTSSLQVNNISELNLKSKSAMFDAKTATNKNSGYDVILERKSFSSLLNDKNIADFLELNYQNQNNGNLYTTLKQAQTTKELTSHTNNITGKDILPSFKQENTIVYNNLSREFNDNLFNKPNENYIAGYKYVDISNDDDDTLLKSNGTAHVAYGLLKNKNNSGLTYGIGATIAQLETDYKNNSQRESNQLGLWMPLGYDFNNGLKWFSKLHMGYADSSYDRQTIFGKKSASYDEYQLGLSNEIRYSINLKNNLRFSPLLELNLLSQIQDDINEGNSQNALNIKRNTSTTLELGLGAYLSKDFTFNDKHNLSIQIGGVYYVEFLDQDPTLKVKVNGMDGTLNILNKQNNNRGVMSLRATYNYKDISVYGNIEKDISDIDALTIDAGMQYKF